MFNVIALVAILGDPPPGTAARAGKKIL